MSKNFIVYHKRKIAFVFVPKAGSTVIKKLAKEELSDIHSDFCPSGYKCFCFVRNPFSRIFASFWHFAQECSPERSKYKQYMKVQAEILQGYLEFTSFVKCRLAHVYNWHFKPMKYFMNIAPVNTTILRFENFSSEMEDILNKQIPHKNFNKLKPDYQQQYNNECIEIVSRLYRWDIENLGYSF
jgi:hypothetical protein